MIRIFKLVLLLVVSQVAFGQAPSNYTNINGRYRWIAGMFDSTFHIPKGTSPSLRTGGSTNAGGLFYNTSDSSVYTYTGTQWIKARGSINPSDTTNKYVTQVYKKNGSDSVFYVKGGNHLFAFVDSVGSPGGGGGGKIYYFNGGVNMGTIGGLQMYELGDTANTGAAANFTRSTTGNIANFITDSNKPGLVQIPAGVWSVDAWLSETGGGANHAEIWIEVEKWDGSTITTIATSPIEQITEGSTPNLYSWSVSIPTTSLTVTDRIIIQFYISNTNGKTVTLYTQNGYVGEVHTTFTTGIGAINGLTAPAQYLVTGTSGTDFNINSVTATHTFNLPTASATNRGALSSTDWTTFNSKIGGSGTTNYVSKFTGSGTIGNSQIFDNATSVGIGTAFPSASYKLDVNGNINVSNAVNYSQGGTKYGWTYATVGAMAMEGLQGADISLGTGSGAVATERMVIKNNGNVGIGITPDSMFTVAQGTHLQRGVRMSGLPSAVGTKTLRIDASGTVSVADTLTNGVSGSGTINRVSKFTASGAIGNSSIRDSSSSVALDISSQGNLGVGYVPNTWFSSVKTIQLPQGSLFSYSSPSKILGLGLNYYADAIGTERYMENGSASIYDQVNGAHRWSSAASGTAGNVISFTTRMLLQQSGELLLGAFTSDSMLNVQSGVHLGRGVRLSGLPTAPGTRALRINANGTLSVSDTLTNGISGSGTTNYIPKFTSSSAIGNSQIFDNGTNVGIGTAAPNTPLSIVANHVSGQSILKIQPTTAYASGGLSSIGFNNSNGTRMGLIYHDATGLQLETGTALPILFNPNGNLRMTLDASGNLGLGVTPSAWSVGSTFDISTKGSLHTSTTVGLLLGRNVYYDGSYKYKSTGVATALIMDDGGYSWQQAPSGTAGNAITFSQAMTLNSSGNLGLGITPSAWGSGQIAFDFGALGSLSTDGSSVVVQNNRYFNGTSNIYKANGYSTLYSQGAGAHVWYIAPSGTAGNAISFTQAMTLDASGNLGIGITSPTGKLHIVGNTASPQYRGFIYTNSSSATLTNESLFQAVTAGWSSNSPEFLFRDDRSDQATTQRIFEVQGARSGVGTILTTLANGNVGIGTTNPDTKLQVQDGFISTYHNANVNDAGYGVEFYTNGGGSRNTIAAIYPSQVGTSRSGNLYFLTSNSGAPTEKMRITSGGDVGINTQTPNATFHVNGSIASAISIKTATYTLTSSDYTVVFDLNGNATANLPNATTCSGRIYVIKINRTNVSDVLTIDPNGAQTIDGNATYDLQCQQAITIQSDGSNWRIIGDFLGGLNCL